MLLSLLDLSAAIDHLILLLLFKADLLSAQVHNRISLLSLLDLSAASETIDHLILLSCFKASFGLSESVLSWFYSYLSDCNETVFVSGSSVIFCTRNYSSFIVPLS